MHVVGFEADPPQILSNYDAQLSHLNKELEQIRSEFVDWETNTKVPTKGVNGVT